MEKRKDMRKAAGEVIWRLRRKAGMSQMALAAKVGISYQQFQKYEYGKSGLSLERIDSIAQVLGLQASELVRHIEIEQQKTD